jgi:predicted O-methyltransferase YrrM
MCLDGFWVRNVDTNTIGSLGVRGLDLIHVDGDHREPGAHHDLCMALDAVKKGGVILVDDVWPGSPVKDAADRFCSERKLESIPVPHLRHLYLINVP